MHLNHLTLSGNLTRDPELRQVGTERSVCAFTIANTHRWKSAEGEQREDTAFVDCEAWGRPGEIVAQYLTKGAPIVIEGRLRMDAWVDKETQQKRSRIKVSVERVHLVPRGERAEGNAQPLAETEAPAPVASGGAPSAAVRRSAVSSSPAPRAPRASAAAVSSEDPPF